MRRLLGLAALGCAVTGVDCKIFRWAESETERNWTPAHETPAATFPLIRSPKPTEPPPAPRNLKKRNAANTCGYVSGYTGDPLYCATTDVCVYNSDDFYIGCCPSTSTECPIPTTCYDLSQSQSYASANDVYALYCANATLPNCIQYIYLDHLFTGYSGWGCGIAAATDDVYYSATTVTEAGSSSPISSSVTASSSSAGGTTSSASTTSSSSSAAATTSSGGGGSKKSSSSNVGPIVGGVVGGVAVIGLIALGVFYIYRRGQKQGAAPADGAAAGAAGAGTGAGAGQSPPPPGGGYDPNNPQMAQAGYYPAAAAGFAPVDPMAKPAYAVSQTTYDNQGLNSPTSTLHTTTPPPVGYAQAMPAASPYQPDGFQAADQHQFYQAAQAPSYAAELPTTRGDGEVRELPA